MGFFARRISYGKNKRGALYRCAVVRGVYRSVPVAACMWVGLAGRGGPCAKRQKKHVHCIVHFEQYLFRWDSCMVSIDYEI